VARLLGGLIFWVILSLVPLTAIPYGTTDEWWQSLFQCVVLASTALWVVEGLLNGKWFVREHRLLMPLVPLLVFVFAQTIQLGSVELAGVRVWRTLSPSPFETRLVAFRFLALLLFAATLLRYTSSKRRLAALVCVVIGVGVSSAVFGVVRQAMHQGGDGFVLPRLQPQLGYGQFINNNHFALLMEMCLGLLLGLLAGAEARRRGGRTFLCLACTVVVWSALVLSTSRGGILAMLGEVTLCALFYRRAGRSPRRARSVEAHQARRRGILSIVSHCSLIVCLLLIVCGGVVWMGGDQLMQRVENLRGEVNDEGASERAYPRRARMWQATWEMIKEHPFAGSGFGGYWLAIDHYYDASGISAPQQAHNEYLELLASGGIVCVVPVAWFVVLFVRRARKCLRSRGAFRRAACLGALLGLCAVALHSLVDFGLHITVNALVFTALVVVAAAHVDADQQAPGGDGRNAHSLLFGRPAAGGLRQSSQRGAAHTVIAVLCLLACLIAMRETARDGLSRWYSLSRAREYSLQSAEQAIRLSPSDPIAHLYRSNMLSADGKDAEGLEELERSAALGPEDYGLWMQIGFARESAGDERGALEDFERAVYLAPFYAQPRWQFGTALFRAGRRDQAFVEIARAAESDPAFLPQVLNLLWLALDGDADAMERVMPPQSTAAQLAFIRFFMEHGKTHEAVALLGQVGSAADAERRTLTADLLAAKRFKEAYDAWASEGRRNAGRGNGVSVVTDGSFEENINTAEPGFGWQVIKGGESLSVSLDTKEPHTGARSLLLNFSGDSPARSPVVSQLILVDANTRYRLSFAARTQELRTTGPPTVELIDAGGGQALIKPMLLPRGDNGWHEYTTEFVTGQATSTVLLTVQRQECPIQPCLIFGRVWLDDFSLRKL
jgi:O-antigen ligase/Tfp pilus assembly protein PilF